jgi:hypothetical protein
VNNITLSSNFTPIGLGSAYYFTGTFDGNNNSISGLNIYQYLDDNIGLFSLLGTTGTLKNLSISGSVLGANNVGMLVGINNGTIINCSSSGTVTNESANINLGGLVGCNHGNIRFSHSSATVTGSSNSTVIGGLIGYNYNSDATICPKVYNCYSTGTVTGTGLESADIGGLVGLQESVYGSQGPVLDTEAHIMIENCFSTSSVTGKYRVGGLVGKCYNHTAVLNSYARGPVNITAPTQPTSYHGGLVGYKGFVSKLTNCYSTGLINPSLRGGGLVGYSTETGYITSCYWDTDLSQIGTSAGGLPLTSAQMKNITNYIGWDFTNVWDQLSNVNDNYPYLLNVTPISDALEPFDTDADGWRNVKILNHLRWISENPSSWGTLSFKLDRNINAAKTKSWNNGLGFSPIGNATTNFTRLFSGNGYIIDSLYINRPTQDYIGLFGYIANTALIDNLTLTNCNITGHNYVGGINGYLYVSGVGHIVTLGNCRTTGAITGSDYVGGLIGKNYLIDSQVNDINIFNSCSFCSVTGNNYVGGLIGDNQAHPNNCYSRGVVTKSGVGNYVGGAIGYNSGTVDKCFSTGDVSTGTGGLIGGQSLLATVTASYWDINTSGKTTSFGGRPETTDSMKVATTFYNWDFTNTWIINLENDGYPNFKNVLIYKRNIENNELNISTKNVDVDIYPNPVSAETKLIINLDQDIYANIHIYNTLGQLVKNCYSGEILKGTKELNLNLQDLNNGSYYLIIENNSVLSCKAIIISR